MTPGVEAKPDKDKGGKGGQVRVESRGGGGAKAQGRVQARPGGNMARVQPNRPSIQTQRFSGQGVRRSSPSVALTGRSQADKSRAGLTYNQRLQQLRAQQQRENWRENMEDRRDRWEDRRNDWKDRHGDGDWHVPYDVHRHWDHNRIHEWNDHRYHWYNNAWVIINPGFGYGYDNGYYGSPGVYYDSGYQGGGSLAAEVQHELARQGYNPGPADGVIGPQTRDAIAGYQRDHGLSVTGRIDTPLVRELGL
jgi:hypothetical protein